ncbi:MAG: hypothetical protein A2161_08375 [Candidatus Schekmanbacteria bacterium RBG_13_48_7]|uniref:Response regulatory domain-containing protein n=1 Tax=Candidatus Schekmanbacteria bacterium RBG_13_48_7 TaxID=1817878 RepID=A0A1F7S686_9BACT|nr:MAG: hypothetical protein A2161_08375 [Candidatus Schekmanbacteria bacterium RBG_13_48_7]
MKSKNILIIEDEIGPREALRIILKNSYEVETVATGKQALMLLEKTGFDLITIDLKLPDILGVKLLETLKTRFPKTEFMVITGYGSYDNLVEIYMMGVPLVFIKPFEINDLSLGIQHAFHRKTILNHIDDLVDWLQKSSLEKGSLLKKSDKKTLEKIKKQILDIEQLTGFYSGHGNNVLEIAAKMFAMLAVPKKEFKVLELACYLHHLGKMGICYPISIKDQSLTTAEQIFLKTYPHQTAKQLKSCNLSEDFLQILLHCEEHYDGTGYPSGLKGEQIPLMSQLLHFSNHLLSLIRNNSFYSKKSHFLDITELIVSDKGKALSPLLVDVYLDINKELFQEIQMI